ncbi:putative RNA-directed DNA polymerase from transposon BS [Fusarium oxysporum f. sp. albedinis]|nr:putative RNA-directed DNA polymerase from transposon BS [Fusarium oxysporum f. sp. albedinis]
MTLITGLKKILYWIVRRKYCLKHGSTCLNSIIGLNVLNRHLRFVGHLSAPHCYFGPCSKKIMEALKLPAIAVILALLPVFYELVIKPPYLSPLA